MEQRQAMWEDLPGPMHNPVVIQNWVRRVAQLMGNKPDEYKKYDWPEFDAEYEFGQGYFELGTKFATIEKFREVVKDLFIADGRDPEWLKICLLEVGRAASSSLDSVDAFGPRLLPHRHFPLPAGGSTQQRSSSVLFFRSGIIIARRLFR
ncbi:hypothetical protein PIB30_014312 [Stylosanthes scabra]|uniref:Uncharacterized protein n=1 Tax=Stylosanthes scabra TaxID=79078 RepID=A0ABU6Q6K1_9FABA|nr:hypothetical protein [Stylosanthes scabra]